MTVDEAIVAIADFLQPLMPSGVEIVRGMTNNTPPPKDGFIVLTEIAQPQYTTTRTTLRYNVGEMDYIMPRYLNVQMDFYGIRAGEMSGIAVTMLRSMYATSNFPNGLEPLYCSDAMQAPLITGEKQFETRWISTLSMQYNAPITVQQESFNTVGDLSVDPVDQSNPAEN